MNHEEITFKCMCISLTLATLQAGEITKYVNPFIGTGGPSMGDFRVILPGRPRRSV